MPIEAILAILGRFIPDVNQREKAEAAVRDAHEKFLLYTSGPIYALYRVAVMFAAAYDLFFNSGAVGARTADTVGLDRAIVALIEFAVALWPFSERVFESVPGAIGQAFARVAMQPPKKPIVPDRPDKPERGD